MNSKFMSEMRAFIFHINFSSFDYVTDSAQWSGSKGDGGNLTNFTVSQEPVELQKTAAPKFGVALAALLNAGNKFDLDLDILTGYSHISATR